MEWKVGKNGTSNNEERVDPDYEAMHVDRMEDINESMHREDARDQTVQKIQKIVHEQFSFEMELKEKEVTNISARLHETRTQLDKLRACILAGYYGYGKTTESYRRDSFKRGRTRAVKTRSKEDCLSEVMKWKQSLPSHMKEHPLDKLSKSDKGHSGTIGVSDEQYKTSKVAVDNHELSDHLSSALSPVVSPLSSFREPTESESRFYVKRRVIVGNTSKYILPEHRESNDRSTHKWMVYVRGLKDTSELQNFISKVWFLLHPSYQPNDLVEVSQPPFQVTRRGWGEFPVRVQLHFIENKNKRVDIIHHLKLDKTYTGLQTLGAETHVDIELDRRNFDDKRGGTLVHNVKGVTETNDLQMRLTKCIDSNDSDAPSMNKFHCHSLNDHSYSAPVKKQESLSCDDGPKYPTPPTSVPGSRCSTPELTKEATCSTLAYECEIDLRKSVKKFPIVNPNFNVALSPYCASSLPQYLSWNIGKRLATEWQRSIAVRNHMQSCHSITNLSAKDIMNYCRLNGFTPTAAISVEGKSLCKVCGEVTKAEDHGNGVELTKYVHKDCLLGLKSKEQKNSLSSADEFLDLIKTCQVPLVELDVQPNEVLESTDIDVVTVTGDLSQEQSPSSGLVFLPFVEELEWVQETAAEVDVHLPGVNIDSVRAPVMTAMLYQACRLLVEDILRKANRFTWKTASRLPKTRCILPMHVKQALEVIPHCDFLTDKYLGVEEPNNEKS